jgi:hypothetical protein
MQRLSVTIVDFMAVLIPGVAFLFGVVIAPWQPAWVSSMASLARIPLLNNDWAAAACWAMTAYILGFMLRLISIELMNRLTARRWTSRLRAQIGELEPSLARAINDEMLVKALQKISSERDRRGVGACAPYFHFAKRIVRTEPELWVEAERLEAEVRLAAGLFVPFSLFAFDGGLRYIMGSDPTDLSLVALGLTGAATIYFAFPERRVKEVLYDYLLALVALRRQSMSDKNSFVQSNPRARAPQVADSAAVPDGSPLATRLEEPASAAKLSP